MVMGRRGFYLQKEFEYGRLDKDGKVAVGLNGRGFRGHDERGGALCQR